MTLFTANCLILFPVAFSLFVATRLSLGETAERKPSIMLMAVQGLTFHMFLFSIIGFGMRGQIIGIPWLVIVLAFCVVLYIKRRRMERSCLLMAAMETDSVENQRLLAMYVERENDGWLKAKGRGLLRDLATGIPFNLSLETRKIAAGIYEVLALRLNVYRVHNRESQVPQAGTSHRSQPQHSQRTHSDDIHLQHMALLDIESEAERMFGRLMIFSWVLVAFPLMALILFFIMPTLAEMHEEMGATMSTSTRTLASLSSFGSDSGAIYVFALIPSFLMALAFVTVAIWLFPSILQAVPFRWFCVDYHRNAGFIAFSHVVDKHTSVADALASTAGIVPVKYIGRRFARAAQMVENGHELGSSLYRSGLLRRADQNRLSRGGTATEMTWGLQQMAQERVHRMLLRYSALVQLGIVILTLLLGAVVGLFGLGVLVGLYSLILEIA